MDSFFYASSFSSLYNKIKKGNVSPLNEIVEFSNETWNQKDGFTEKFPYIEISEIDTGTGGINNVPMVPIKEAPSRARMVVRTNDIIVSTTRPNRGAISLIKEASDGSIASTGFAVLRKLKTDKVEKKYLFYILNRLKVAISKLLNSINILLTNCI